MKNIRIGEKEIGDSRPCFIIAEAGVNHNGSLEIAKKLIDVAYTSGADAIKFQTFSADKLVTTRAEKAKYQKETTNAEESQYDMIKKLEIGENGFKILKEYCDEIGIILLSSPFDVDSVDILDRIGVSAYKIPSGEIINHEYLKHIASKSKPIILSTGMANVEEIEEAINILKESNNDQIILLQCVTSYPARYEDSNLKVIQTLKNKFGLMTGMSDHTPGIIVPGASVAMGANVLEKHFTLDKNLPGPDHKASLEPSELKEMVNSIRKIESALGDGKKIPTPAEEEIKKTIRKSIVADQRIQKGSSISIEMLSFKRPGTGILPKDIDKVVGKIARIDIKKDEIINFDDLSN